MEKRVFSLSSAGERHFLVGYFVFYTLFLVFVLSMSRGLGLRCAWAMVILLNFVVQLWRYLALRSRTLEVSDKGLVLTSWPWQPAQINWDAVRKVELFEKPSIWTVRPFLYIIASDSRGRVVKIPVYPPGFEELAGIMRARLPDSILVPR